MPDVVRTCRLCGCTEDDPCVDQNSGDACSWTDADLCSFCDELSAAYLAGRATGMIDADSPLVDLFVTACATEEAEEYLRARRKGDE